MTSLQSGGLSLRNLSKGYALADRQLSVLNGINLDIEGGSSLAIVGASGSGKTTLLRILAGLEDPDRGGVTIDGTPVRGVGTERAVIFQEPRLLPWLTVLDNVAFGLEVRGTPRAEALERARHYVRLVGLSDFAGVWPRQLSGGMAQRVGIARALTVQPRILLLDEPFGALDAMTRLVMQEELVRIWGEEKVTMIVVTHDLEEAIYLADQVLVLPKGEDAPRLIETDLPRPRDRTSPAFVRQREALLREFGLH
ncbi:ABC transporter ATP-binding protein [Cereibacter sp. SYSU M97828]|nr:ABC transporter ATP-binding protein [Cereibacter flavus]